MGGYTEAGGRWLTVRVEVERGCGRSGAYASGSTASQSHWHGIAFDKVTSI
jgi:hypothetical protein